MKFKKITIKNLLSYGNHPEVYHLDSPSLCHISGANGTGKSSLSDAITFGLFGKTFRKLKKGELVNKINNKDLLVELEFEQHGSNYLVRRGLRPHIFEIYKDGELINQSSTVLDYQYILETDIIGYNFELFRQLIILSATSFSSFFEMSSGQRRTILEELLSLREIGEMLQILQGKLSNNKSEMTEKQATLRELSNTINTLTESINESQKKANESGAERSEKVRTLLTKVEKLRAAKSKLESVVHSIELDQVNSKLTVLSNGISSLRTNLGKLDFAAEKFDNELQFIMNNTVCPNCQQDIEEHHKDKMVSILSDKKSKSVSGVQSLTSKLNELEDDLADTQHLKKKWSDTQVALQNVERDITSILNEIKWLEEQNESEVDSNLIQTLNNSVERMNELQSTIEELGTEKELLDTAKEFLSDDGIRKMIIKKYIPFISQKINWWLQQLDLFATVTINDDFEESIKMRGFDPTRYHNLSSGEKSKLTLATVFAFRELLGLRNNTSMPFLWIDEILENIDKEGKSKLLFNLRDISEKNNISIYVVSHGLGDDVDPFHRGIRMFKEGNFTKHEEMDL